MELRTCKSQRRWFHPSVRQNYCLEPDYLEMYSSDGTITNLGTTIQATSVSQLESHKTNELVRDYGRFQVNLAGLEIPVNVASIFAEQSGAWHYIP